MCGIAAVIGETREGEWQQTHDLMTALLVRSMPRGRDATGFAAITSPLDDPTRHRMIVAKEPLAAEDFVSTNPFWRQLRRLRCLAVLGHVRAATSGSPAVNANNHPHLFSGKRFGLVHNGWYVNTGDVMDRHALKVQTECDSEVAARLIEASPSVPEGLVRCLTDLKGAQALCVLDGRSGTIWCARDAHRPLWMARLRDGRRMVLASTAEIICKAVEDVMGPPAHWLASIHPIASWFVHGITVDGRLIAPYMSESRPTVRNGH